VTPDNTSEFVIYGSPQSHSVNEGLAQAGSSTTITLNADASSADDAYIGQLVFLVSGTGSDQAALITDYNGTTKVATIETGAADQQWVTTPDTTTAYRILPASPVQVQAAIAARFDGIEGATFDTATDSLEQIRNNLGGGAGGGGDATLANQTTMIANQQILLARTSTGVVVTFARCARANGDFDVPIQRGDSYSEADGNAFTFTANDLPAATWEDGTTATLKIKQDGTWLSGTLGTVSLVHDGVEKMSGTISFTTAQTEALTGGVKTSYEVELVNGTSKRTIYGDWAVRDSDEA
jgi:hypothetical protein